MKLTPLQAQLTVFDLQLEAFEATAGSEAYAALVDILSRRLARDKTPIRLKRWQRWRLRLA